MGPTAELSEPSLVATQRTQVHAVLREQIMRAELAPGQRLSENELAAALGVSRTPVREALARLRDDRLVFVAPQRGTYVTRISAAAVADAQFIRETLECAAVRRAVERRSDEDVAALEGLLEAQSRAVGARDLDAFYLLDDELHRTLCDLSGHPSVWRIAERAKVHLNRVRRLSLPQPDYLPAMLAEHRAVVARVAAEDADGAEHALREHLRGVLREVPRIRTSHPDFFEEP